MGLFSRRAKQTDVDELRRQVASMSTRLDNANKDNEHLREQLVAARGLHTELDERINELSTNVEEAAALPAPTQKTSIADQAVVDELRLRIGKLQTRVDDMDARVTSATTELANQINELSNDIDRGSAGVGGEAAASAVKELRDSQVRLANEQARYQIAFREDLAALAEKVKR